MFTADIPAVFNLDDTESAELFDVFKRVYVDFRYKDLFEADELAVEALYEVFSRFVTVTEKICKMYLLTSSL